jgi:hypothetical protein
MGRRRETLLRCNRIIGQAGFQSPERCQQHSAAWMGAGQMSGPV